ncbi:C39 family peptidase [Kribbella amoyensis]|uniref:C39 family peptidase n=1 Tax=Kribbella amoyensis TaxID=996641 RepID=UPI001EE2AF9B|nr:C39 family peptidase [Kribbella amoyensis]
MILLGALLAQAPSAAAYEPREPSGPYVPPAAPGGPVVPATTPSTAPDDQAGPETDPTAGPTPTVAPEPDPAALPAARSWSEVAQQVAETSPGDISLRSADVAQQSTQVMRCFKLEDENYCLGLGFVDKVPSGAQLSEAVSAPAVSAQDRAADGSVVEQDIATGAQSPAAFVSERAAMPKTARVNAELEEMQSAWDGRDKARALRLLDDNGNPPPAQPTSPTPTPSTPTPSTPTATPSTGTPSTGTPSTQSREAEPRADGTVPPPTPPTGKPSPPPVNPPAAVKTLPASKYIMKGFQTSQEKGYWCGPATFQSIDWADDNQKDTQASWAKDLGATTSGTAISAMVKQTNLKTNWDIAAGTYIVQNVGHWTTQKFFQVHQNHLGDGAPAPVIEHVQLLKRYFPYLAFNHSGHYQVGRGYDRNAGTIGIFEVFNERRFNSRGNVTDGPKNIPASALFNATLANQFKNIGL